jgi:hypothetical protein
MLTQPHETGIPQGHETHLRRQLVELLLGRQVLALRLLELCLPRVALLLDPRDLALKVFGLDVDLAESVRAVHDT